MFILRIRKMIEQNFFDDTMQGLSEAIEIKKGLEYIQSFLFFEK